MTQTIDFSLSPENKIQLAHLCGEQDRNLNLVAKRLNIDIYNRGFNFRLVGVPHMVESGKSILTELYQQALHPLTSELVHLQIIENLPRPHAKTKTAQPAKDTAEKESASTGTKSHSGSRQLIHIPKKTVRTRNRSQDTFVDDLRSGGMSFGIGPAGTGKTFLAIAVAAEMLTARKYERLVITRPAVEAGEKLGFLPGDFSQKVDPYLRPIFDALYETLGIELTDNLISRNVIEVAPLAFMRGRTFNHAFIVLDEAQNTTIEQMKMFLTRSGIESTVVVTGDPSQVDLPRNITSGLMHAVSLLEGIPEIQVRRFTSHDIVRSPLVQSVVQAYERDSRKQKSYTPTP